MITDDDATPEQIEQHLNRLIRLNKRANYAEDWTTVQWTTTAIERCRALLDELYSASSSS